MRTSTGLPKRRCALHVSYHSSEFSNCLQSDDKSQKKCSQWKYTANTTYIIYINKWNNQNKWYKLKVNYNILKIKKS